MRSVAVSVLLAVGVSASTAWGGNPFLMFSVQAGGGILGLGGSAITWAPLDMPFIDQSVLDAQALLGVPPVEGNFFSPTQASMLGNPNLQYSFYVGMDPIGPTTPGSPGHQSNILFSSIPTPMLVQPGEFRGAWFSSPPFTASSSTGSMFLMNITLPGGGHTFNALMPGVEITIAEPLSPTTHLTANVFFGASNAVMIGSQLYYLDFTATPVSLASLRGGGPTHTNYVIGLQSVAVPAPASLTPLALLGVIGARRRRAR